MDPHFKEIYMNALIYKQGYWDSAQYGDLPVYMVRLRGVSPGGTMIWRLRHRYIERYL